MEKNKKTKQYYQPVEDLQEGLFSNEESWREHWKGMPEFVQDKVEPYAAITVRFSTKEDLDEFSRLIGQKLNKKSQCTWFPEFVAGFNRDKRYTDES